MEGQELKQSLLMCYYRGYWKGFHYYKNYYNQDLDYKSLYLYFSFFQVQISFIKKPYFSSVEYLLRKGDEAAQSFKVMKSKKLFVSVFVTSIIIWCFQYLAYYILAIDIEIPLAFWSMIFAITFFFFTTVLPVQTIGGFGVVEGGWTLGLMIVGISKEISISSGFAFHIILGFLMGLTSDYLPI